MFFFMKELYGRDLISKLLAKPGGGPEGPGPLNCNATNDKNLTKKPWFFIFSFF